MMVRYLPEATVVRLPDGRYAFSPNKPHKRDRYCFTVSKSLGVDMRGADVVEVVKYPAALAHEELERLNGGEGVSLDAGYMIDRDVLAAIIKLTTWASDQVAKGDMASDEVGPVVSTVNTYLLSAMENLA